LDLYSRAMEIWRLPGSVENHPQELWLPEP
jgi:hypothetical protein